ncbi:MAG: hypothetical protein ACREB8_09060 [Pseudolabrys sp.]
MALVTRATVVASEPAVEAPIIRGLNWGERIVTVVAASTAVLVVATIAVLMGMA